MASYYDDAYDSRTRPSRRQDSYSRPRDDQYLKPTAGASEPRRRVGESASEGQNGRHSRSQRSPARYTHDGYDTRYDYPPPLPPDTGPPAPRRDPSRLRKKPSYPPPPSCEDEVRSLAREAGSQKLLRELGQDDVPSRGKIDQETLVEEVPELINRDERRFVLQEHDPSKSQPTPPTSEDEKARRKARRRPSKLDMNFAKVESAVPEMNKRTASPYAFAKGNEKASREFPGARFLSPDDILSPPPTESNSRRRAPASRSQPSSPQRDSDRHSPKSASKFDYFSIGQDNAIDDSDHDRARTNPKDKAATHPPTGNFPSMTGVVDFAPQPNSASIRKRHLDARRNTDTSTTLPTMRSLNADRSKRPAPLTAAAALSGLGVPMASSPQATLGGFDYPLPRSRESSYATSRGPSPASSAAGVGGSTTPQRSPRMSAELFRDEYERPPTRESSVSSSRPQSPSPLTPSESPRLPKTELDWSVLLAANAGRRNTRRSRLSAEMPMEPSPPPSRGYMRQAMSTARVDSLPYPVDDGPSTPSVWMPSEKLHQFFPDQRQTDPIPFREEPKSLSSPAPPAVPSGSTHASSGPSRPTRPGLPTRYSTADLPDTTKPLQQQSDKPRANESRRAAAFATSSQTKKDLEVLLKRPLPPCARTRPVAGYSDWYTLIGSPNLDFCPDCVTDVFDRTIFRNSFRRSPPYNLDEKVRCALGGMPWIRLAWLMSLQQKRTDLHLMHDMAEVEGTSTACSGDQEAARTWYGLRDKDGQFVRDFRICYGDVRKVEVLLPTLSGIFVRLPQRGAEEVGICAIRQEGNRFSIYIDALIKTHEKAGRGGSPDIGPFISLVEWRSELRECSKDALIKKGLWHFMPELPELTVCEDCFLTVVEPHLSRSTSSSGAKLTKPPPLATLFNRTLQPLPTAPTYDEAIGSSCQLYSTRMRRVFLRALHDDDFKYLARKVRERRQAEVRLQERYRALRGRLGRARGEEEVERVEREIGRVAGEWRGEWE